ncbi:SusC/RagA family TonB-linked outer membrane protein [Pinibacter aurantiacus]|uniref:TonB-dependent receptor n=1 Tax=Pinibacter aurantiacus TaxID=2851599 RepID=A0A9E2SDA3_9BACT|nr:TonB-dependent receptor [Pinibacter aurantiacus]MBV4359024.1 TonB-dependent receptor [Pinibacter aurantiacus]
MNNKDICRYLLFALVLQLGFYLAGYSQSQMVTIHGTIKNASGEVLGNASIIPAGAKQKGKMSDEKGNYSITVPANTVIEFSYLGYLTKTLKAEKDGEVNITLSPNADRAGLSDVVVVGYGKQKLPTVTGAVGVIGGKELLQTPVANLSNMLVGRTSGLSSVQASGEPGLNNTTIRIRGIATTNGADPLIVIDGIQQPAEQPYAVFNTIDPNEVESISVLKDASATAVYGIRGANGVIIVTTKRGRVNKPQFSFTMNQGFTKATSIFQTINSYQFATLRNEAIYNAKASGDNSFDNILFTNDEIWKFQNNRDYTPAEVDAMPNITAEQKEALKNSPALYYTSHNYYKEQFGGTGRQQQYNLNVSGGTEKVRYFTSLGYFQQGGILSNTDYGDANTNPLYKRYNFRSNFDVDVAKNFQLSFNIAGLSSAAKVPGANTSSTAFADRYQSIIQTILESSPFVGPGIVDGHLITGFIGDAGTATNPLGLKGGSGSSPLAQLLTAGTRTMYTTTLTSNVTLKHSMNYLTKGLEAHVQVAYDDSYSKGYNQINSVPQYSAMRNPSNPAEIVYVGGVVNPTTTADNQGNSAWRKLYLEAAVNYNRRFGDHTVSGLVLGNAQRYTANGMSYNVPSGLMGFVSRLTYNYKERYMVEGNLGINGTENFAPGKRFGVFPAVSAGWIVTNENFIPKNPWLTFLKIRGSYGEVGNDQIGGRRFFYLPNTWAYSSGATSGYNFGNSNGSTSNPKTNAYQEGALGNPNVTWERAQKSNIAADMKFISDKLSLSVSLFSEKRNNILVTSGVIPGTWGVPSGNIPPVNVGRVSNKGYEIEAGWNDKIGNVSYFVRGNFSYARNKIEYQAEAPYPYPWMNATGYSIGQYKGLLTDGFYNTPEELNNRPYNNYGNKAKLGDLRFRDITGDGIINQNDNVPIGYSNLPRIAYNFTLGFSYKGFDVNALFIGTAQGSFPQSGYILSTPFAKNVGEVLQYMYDGRWTAEKYAKGEAIYYPEISMSGSGPNNTMSDFWVKPNDFIRLKNLEVGYSLPVKLVSRAGIKGMRIYANGNNLITWGSKLIDGIDPEQADVGKNSMGYLYPLTRTFNVGANIQF